MASKFIKKVLIKDVLDDTCRFDGQVPLDGVVWLQIFICEVPTQHEFMGRVLRWSLHYDYDSLGWIDGCEHFL
jgi:hypothetical protein